MQLEHTSSKSIEFILDYLTDMDKFASIHPVISKIKPLGRQHFIVYETLQIGPVPWSFTYPAQVILGQDGMSVTIKAIVMKVTKIEMVFEISKIGPHSLIKEKIHMETPLPVKKMMQKIFKKQHLQFFKTLESL